MQHEESPFKGKTGLRRLWERLPLHVPDGFAAAYKCEDAFRQEVRSGGAAQGPAGLFPAGQRGVGRALMVGSVLLVLIVELLNSAIEAVVDRVSLERHPLAKAPRTSAALRSSSLWPTLSRSGGCVLFL